MPATTPWIAIVDDDPSVLKALSRSLRVREFQSRTFGSAHDFLASLAEGLPQCLIVDLQMPEMTGLELHHQLTLSGVRIPTIIVTAHGDTRVRDRAESAGVIATLFKPLQNETLFAAINKAIGTEQRRH